ncbi:MAG: hypothetical protein ACRCX2_15000 [Paraclostridium sp.]
MEEEIVIQETIEEVVDTPEEVVIEEEVIEDKQDDNDEFDPESFDDDDLYSINGMDFSDLKDDLGLEGDGRVELLSTYVTPFIEQGFTEEQIKFIIKRDLEFDDGSEEKTPKKKTAKDIQNELKSTLTTEEKRNYKAINRFAGDLLSGTELQDFKKEIMETPQLVKLFNIMYTKSLGKTANINSSVPKVAEKQIKSVTFDDAYNQITESIRRGNKTETKKLVDDLSKKVTDRENFSAIIKALGL